MSQEAKVLKPCPWCGDATAFVERADYSSCYVHCNGCGAHGPIGEDTTEDSSEEVPGYAQAGELWNHRTEPAASAQQDKREAPELWCLYVDGMDEFHAMYDKADAESQAAELASWYASKEKHEHDPHLSWAVVRWPSDAASHARSLINQYREHIADLRRAAKRAAAAPAQRVQADAGAAGYGLTQEGDKRLMGLLTQAFGSRHQAVDDLAALILRANASRRDVGRYRWLRGQHWNESDMAVVFDPKKSVKLGYDCPSGERLDEAIDAAMKRSGEQKA